jgi:hypothetical protein
MKPAAPVTRMVMRAGDSFCEARLSPPMFETKAFA